MATTETTKATNFEAPAVPDLKKAEALSKNLQLAPPAAPGQRPIVVITDDDHFIASWPIIQRHDEVIKLLSDGDPEKGIVGFDPFVNGLFKLHKMACQLRAQFLNPVLASKEAYLRGRMIYTEAKEALKKKQDEAAAEALRKQQAKDLNADAKKLEKQGDVESAAVLREQAKTLPTPFVSTGPAVPKQEGSVTTPKWEFEVENFDKVPDLYKLLDHTKKGERDLIESKIRAIVSRLGDKIKIDGVRIWHTKSESSRGKR